MQKQILSVAIALPTILLSALPSLANPIQVVTPKVRNLQLGSQSPAVSNQFGHSRNTEAPGPVGGVNLPKPPPPVPPRRDPLLQIRGTNLQNTINPSSVNLNINQRGLGR